MKIVIIIDWFIYYAVELVNGLVDRGNDVLLITRDHNYEISSKENPISLHEFLDRTLDKRVKLISIRYPRRSFKNLSQVHKINNCIKLFNPDVVHVQHNLDWRILLISLLNKNILVTTIHDVEYHTGDKYGFQKHVWTLQLYISKKIIVHGHFLKDQFKRNHPNLASDIFVAHHGVLSIYKKWDDLNIEENENTILFFGRLSKYKGLDILLEAHRLILEKMPQVKLIIAGKGEALPIDAFEDAQKKSMEIHHRFIPNNEVPRFFRRAAVIVLPYTEASQSGVVPIAYSFGKPVVVTAVGSIPEVVKNGISGLVVPSNDPFALSEALINILGNSELRRKMGKNAQKIAENELSWNVIAKHTMEIYAHGV